MSKCSECLFCGKWHDMGASTYVCTLESDLTKAINRFNNNHFNRGYEDKPCSDRLTKDEAIKLRASLKMFENTKYSLLCIYKDKDDIIVLRDFEPICFTNNMELALNIVKKLL